ncbi:MAG: hypothetical protein U0359_32740 [Byssovorax sp.]
MQSAKELCVTLAEADLPGSGGALSAARALVEGIEALPHLAHTRDLRLALALALDIVDILTEHGGHHGSGHHGRY